MWGLTRSSLQKHIDQERIVRAIMAAERRSSGEIRVSIAPFFWGSVETTARKAFHRLGMETTKDRNGVLIFLVPSRRRFAIIGDEGIHAKVGQAFWDEVSACLSGHFKKSDYTEGLEKSIALLGERLAEHFPYQAGLDRNELPDDVDFNRSH